MAIEPVRGSFRDPAGFVYRRDGIVLRQIHASYAPIWDRVVETGLYGEMVNRSLAIPVLEAPLEWAASSEAVKVIQPEPVATISYPYEWCFSQLQDAALATLAAMRLAMEKGFWLRDASAFNIQFFNGKPVLIDSLSFGSYEEGKPWPAYGQFCRHFLAPLALMALVDPRLSDLLRSHIDGIPLDLATRLLPKSSRWSVGLGVHLHLHARAQSGQSAGRSATVSRQALLGMVDSLESTVRKLNLKQSKTVWGNYYAETNYDEAAFASKRAMVSRFLSLVPKPLKCVWDLGANTGVLSEEAADLAEFVVAWDFDTNAVEGAYKKWRSEGRTNLLPLRQDLTNPSPSLGWGHAERMSLAERGPVDAVMALALIHHLAIGNNVPLPEIALWLATLSSYCILEFVPKEDSQVKRMLSSREDVFHDYHLAGFLDAFTKHFEVVREEPIVGTERTLCLLRSR